LNFNLQLLSEDILKVFLSTLNSRKGSEEKERRIMPLSGKRLD